MATVSEVKAGMDEISTLIKNSRSRLSQAKEHMKAMAPILNAIPTKYADVLAEINGYPGDTPFQALEKDELALLTVEFLSLVEAVGTANTALEAITEF